MKHFLVKTRKDFDLVDAVLDAMIKAGVPATVIVDKASKMRTQLQNSSLHVYCRKMAKRMADAGLTQRMLWEIIKEGFEVPVTERFVKEIFQEVCRQMYGTSHTSKTTTAQISEAYMVFDCRMGELTSIREEWPSLESQREAA